LSTVDNLFLYCVGLREGRGPGRALERLT
jgi:hypothetical protein